MKMYQKMPTKNKLAYTNIHQAMAMCNFHKIKFHFIYNSFSLEHQKTQLSYCYTLLCLQKIVNQLLVQVS